MYLQSFWKIKKVKDESFKIKVKKLFFLHNIRYIFCRSCLIFSYIIIILNSSIKYCCFCVVCLVFLFAVALHSTWRVTRRCCKYIIFILKMNGICGYECVTVYCKCICLEVVWMYLYRVGGGVVYLCVRIWLVCKGECIGFPVIVKGFM